MSEIIHGTCSQCGGPVTTPRHWLGVNPPIPTCRRCGATKKQPHGHVIEMEGGRRAGSQVDAHGFSLLRCCE